MVVHTWYKSCLVACNNMPTNPNEMKEKVNLIGNNRLRSSTILRQSSKDS